LAQASGLTFRSIVCVVLQTRALLRSVFVVYLPSIFMMHLPGVVLFILFLLGTSRRTFRINDFFHNAQKHDKSLTNSFKVTAVVQEALLPGGFPKLAGAVDATKFRALQHVPRGAKVAIHDVGERLADSEATATSKRSGMPQMSILEGSEDTRATLAETHRMSMVEAVARRELISKVSLALAAGSALLPGTAWASGGATAGRTTSIPRAKLRYFDRVSGAIGAFERLEAKLADQASCKSASAAFFNEKVEDAPIVELKSAGYLLAVAFKIDSKIPPDRIQQVKDYKVMMKDLTALGKSMSSGNLEAAKKAYEKASASIAVYLEGVELPELGSKEYEKS